MRLVVDIFDIATDLLLVSAVENAYRFLYRVRSNNHIRVVDPSDAIVRLTRGIQLCERQHKSSLDSRTIQLGQETCSYTLDEALGRWSNIELDSRVDRANQDGDLSDNQEVIRLSHVLDSHLKFSLLLALTTNDGMVTNDGSSCLSCVQEQVKAAPVPVSRHSGLDDQATRAIINVRANLTQPPAKTAPKCKAIEALSRD